MIRVLFVAALLLVTSAASARPHHAGSGSARTVLEYTSWEDYLAEIELARSRERRRRAAERARAGPRGNRLYRMYLALIERVGFRAGASSTRLEEMARQYREHLRRRVSSARRPPAGRP